MSHSANDLMLERAVELADELGGDFPEEVGLLITQFGVDLDEVRAYIAYMQCILRYRDEVGVR